MKIKAEQLIDIVQITAWTEEDGKEKRLQTPFEVCSVNEFNFPSDASVQYWFAHGVDRKLLRLS